MLEQICSLLGDGQETILLTNTQSPFCSILALNRLAKPMVTLSRAEYLKSGGVSLRYFMKQTFEDSVCSNDDGILVIEEIYQLIKDDGGAEMELYRLLSLYSHLAILAYSKSTELPLAIKDCFDMVLEVPSILDKADLLLLNGGGSGDGEGQSYEEYLGCQLTRTRSGTIGSKKSTLLPVGWNEVGGLKHTKEELLRMAEAILLSEDDAYKQYQYVGCDMPNGILLAGPPGTGKTLLVRALASKLSCSFLIASLPDLLHAHVGESEQAILHLFNEARALQPSIVFIDELDALFSTAGIFGIGKKLSSQLVFEFDSLSQNHERILVIAATNHLDCIEPRLVRVGRFEVVLRMDLPNDDDRGDILGCLQVPDTLIGSLIPKTDGMSGAEIFQVVQLARQNALERNSKILEFIDFHGQFESSPTTTTTTNRGHIVE